MGKGFITYCLVVPSCLKSCATLLPLTGRESSIGVWITCRSPAPNVMVLYWLKKREREGDKEGIENETGDPGVVLQKIRLWRRGLISGANPESSVSQRQPHGQSQKLSRYITKKKHKPFQLIGAEMELGRTPCQRPYCTTTPAKPCQWTIMGDRNPRQVSYAGHLPQ